ncbi:hypothetical protein ASG12_17840 [Williamsia sp. Leaf354]|nr:hypothetical protein ASG12_17840 [Williamsia sp. Leaf354]
MMCEHRRPVIGLAAEEWESNVAMQLRSQKTSTSGRVRVGQIDDTRTLGQLVGAAAAIAPGQPAICKPGLTITFGQLATSAFGAVGAMSGGDVIDDSALTVALMMNVPGLALSGPTGLAATLISLRVQASVALAGAERA